MNVLSKSLSLGRSLMHGQCGQCGQWIVLACVVCGLVSVNALQGWGETIEGTVPFTVDLDASDSTDPDGDALSFAWSYGDGKTASGITSQHTYDTEGEYTLTLDVIDEHGAKDSVVVSIVAHAPTPPELAPVEPPVDSGEPVDPVELVDPVEPVDPPYDPVDNPTPDPQTNPEPNPELDPVQPVDPPVDPPADPPVVVNPPSDPADPPAPPVEEPPQDPTQDPIPPVEVVVDPPVDTPDDSPAESPISAPTESPVAVPTEPQTPAVQPPHTQAVETISNAQSPEQLMSGLYQLTDGLGGGGTIDSDAIEAQTSALQDAVAHAMDSVHMPEINDENRVAIIVEVLHAAEMMIQNASDTDHALDNVILLIDTMEESSLLNTHTHMNGVESLMDVMQAVAMDVLNTHPDKGAVMSQGDIVSTFFGDVDEDGAEERVVGIGNGDATMTIPPGLFNQSLQARIQRRPLDSERAMDNMQTLSEVVEFTLYPAGSENPMQVAGLSTPLTLQIPLSADTAVPTNAQAYYYDENTHVWKTDGITDLSYSPGTGWTFKTTHLTDFIILASTASSSTNTTTPTTANTTSISQPNDDTVMAGGCLVRCLRRR